MPSNKIGRIAALDSVRGMAAFIVVIHHCFLTRAVYSDFFFTQWKTTAPSANLGHRLTRVRGEARLAPQPIFREGRI